MKCRAELCLTWTGEGCICVAIGLEPPLSDDLDDLYDTPEGPHPVTEDPRGFGPIFTAGHHSEDACCGDGIVPGEDIRADGAGGWIHADDQCERLVGFVQESLARAAEEEQLTCHSCLLIHKGECFR